MIAMGQLYRLFVLTLVVLTLQISSAPAGAGDLTLPERADAQVVLALDAGQETVDPPSLLQIFTGAPDVCCDGKKPMAGRYRVEDRVLIFDPAFDLIEGRAYTVRSQLAGNVEPRLTPLTIQSTRDIVPPRVTAIYPGGAVLPANTLRFYIHFSTPMKPHASADYIKLLDVNGTPDNAAFMSFKQELWSEDRKRLTLLMDPGRIKRGVAQNMRLGPALHEGKPYSLVVEAGWPGATGAEDLPRFEKRFTVGPALRRLPSPDLWTIASPMKGTRDPLVVTFDRPFDHALLQRALIVQDNAGNPIAGSVSSHAHETVWRFEPQLLWTDGDVQIRVDTTLEDVAGNSFRDLLDHSAGTVMADVDNIVISVRLRPEP